MSEPIAAPGGPGAEPDFVIDAAMIAPMLGLAPDAFMRGIQRGIVMQRTERGIDDDAGRFRVTFRYLRRRCQVVVDAGTGIVLPG